jgi:hypothetical protein
MSIESQVAEKIWEKLGRDERLHIKRNPVSWLSAALGSLDDDRFPELRGKVDEVQALLLVAERAQTWIPPVNPDDTTPHEAMLEACRAAEKLLELCMDGRPPPASVLSPEYLASVRATIKAGEGPDPYRAIREAREHLGIALEDNDRGRDPISGILDAYDALVKVEEEA